MSDQPPKSNNTNGGPATAATVEKGQNGPILRIPDSKLKSREDRLDFIKSQLSGQSLNTTGRAARLQKRMKNEPAGALLYGATLHAAARHARGLELSPLEDKLFNMLKLFGSEDDIHECGRTYENEKQERSTHTGESVIPNAILDIDVTTSYSREDYKRDADAYVNQFMTAPNTYVRVGDAPEADTAENGEKNNFAATTGTALTYFLAEGESIDRPPVDTRASTNDYGTEYRVMMTKFQCVEESHEFSGSDEIYWSISSSSDYGYHYTWKSPVYGSVDSGKTKSIDERLFEGPMGKYAAATIEVWEHDDDGESWIASLRRTLREMGVVILEASLEAAELNATAGAYGAAVGAALLLVDALIGWWLNHDDFVAKHKICWSPARMEELAKSGQEVSVLFDGGGAGRHRLYYKVLYMANSFRSNAMSVWTRHGTWSSHSTIPGPHTRHSSLVVFKGKLYAILQRQDDWVLMYSEYSDSSKKWLWPRVIEGVYSLTWDHPRAVEAHGELWVAFTGLEHVPRLIHTKGGNLNSWAAVVTDSNKFGALANNGPGLALYSGHLAYGIRESSQDVFLMRWYNHPNPDFHACDMPWDLRPWAHNGIQIVTFQNDLYYFAVASDGELKSYRRTASGTCTKLPTYPGKTDAVPVVTVVDDRIYVISRSDGQYVSKWWDCKQWVPDAKFGNPKYSGGGIHYKGLQYATGANYD
ncbi:hypothetical protein ACET3X_002107 [Alternaria dauci]|uniref:Fucose-specific lectin n=1 Tax=Alternaria dauci TaxID=48095 RepID=A0ABR3UZ92_9PLEO